MDWVRDSNRNLPRYTWSGSSIETWNNHFDPTEMKYLYSLAIIFGVIILVWIIQILFTAIYWLIRLCCFRGKFRRTSNKLAIIWFFAIMPFLALIGISIFAYVVNINLIPSLSSLFNTVNDQVLQTNSLVSTINTQFASLANPGGTVPLNSTGPTQALNDVSSALNSVSNTINDVKDSAVYYNQIRSYVYDGLLAAFFLLSFFMTVCILLKQVKITKISVLLTSVFLFFVAIGFGLHLTIGVGGADMCKSVGSCIDERRTCQSNQETNPSLDCASSSQSPSCGVLNDVIQCAGTNQQADIQRAQWENMAILLYGSTNGVLNTSATPSNPTPTSIRGIMKVCGFSTTYSTYGEYRTSFTNASTLVQGDGVVYNSLYNTTADNLNYQTILSNEGVGSCVNGSASGWYQAVNSTITLKSMSDNINTLTQCGYILNAFDKIQSNFCHGMLDDIDQLAVSFGIIWGCLLVGLIASGAWLLNRKRPKQERRTNMERRERPVAKSVKFEFSLDSESEQDDGL